MMDFVQRMKRALQRGRSATLPPDNEDAVYVLLPYVMQNQVKPVNELLTNSTFDVNHQFGRARRTLVHSAANTGASDCLALLLKKGASVNIQDKIGVTALHLAARNGHKKCVQKLVDAGAAIGVHDNEGLTALHWLACNGRTELLGSILPKVENVDVEDVHGHTALHVACQNGHYQCAIKLLEYKADVHKINKNGGNTLYFACRHGQVKCVRMLLGKGAKVLADNNGVSSLELCAQNNYHECAGLILSHYPNEVDHLLSLVFSDKIEEAKMHSLMEFLSTNHFQLLAVFLSKLASRTCTAGMELLSVSSSYQDLMPQFLRAIRMLCNLYKYYFESAKDSASQSPEFGSVPASPSVPYSDVSKPTVTVSVRRTGSFGSILDSPRNAVTVGRSGGGRSMFRRGHRRAHSGPNSDDGSDSPRDARSNTIAAVLPGSSSSGQSRSKSSSISDPFDQLETVWASLESWFDLLAMEVEKVQKQEESTDGEDGTEIGFADIEETPSTNGTAADIEDKLPSGRDEDEVISKPKKKPNLKLPSSELAAAIVKSTPVERRAAFLKASVSFDTHLLPLSKLSEAANKRRSWNVDRVTAARFLSVAGAQGVQSPLPEFGRSLSSDSTLKYPLESSVNGVEMNNVESSKPSLVDVYSDRLCAITHAFALCCSTVRKTIGGSGLLARFADFIDKYEAVLKLLLARNPQLIFAHFHFLLEHMELLTRFMHIVRAQPFEDRKNWFYENLYKGKPPSTELTLAAQSNVIQVDRENIFTTSCKMISDVPIDSLKDGLSIQFQGEAGMGSGVKREWFDNLSREILNPDYALFTQSADGATFQPNSLSDVNPDHLSYFKFAGRMMGLAIYHKQLLNVYFTRSFYKHILGIPVSYRDVESIDPEYANNLQWLLDNAIDSLELGLTFALETDVFGATEHIDLKTGGTNITVTDTNKKEYVQLVTEMRMTQAIGLQIRSFLDGFYETIPHELIALFDEYELELLISGLPDIDVEDWEMNTEYSSGYDEDSQVVKWFWEIVKSCDQKHLAILLQFVTGSSRVPLGGFCNLVGATGLTKFTIARVEFVPNRLPMASTCFNLLKLPDYPTKLLLQERLNVAITCGIDLIDIT